MTRAFEDRAPGAPRNTSAEGRRRPLDLARANAKALGIAAVLATGIALVILGWYGAAHTNIVSEQIPYLISGGLLGLGLIIVAAVLAASAAHERQAEHLRRDIMRALTSVRASADPQRRSPPTDDGLRGRFVLRGGRTRHQPDCPLLEGKDGVRELNPQEAARLPPCKLCAPE